MASAGPFAAVERDGDQERVLGTVTLDDDGRLAITGGAGGERLQTIVDELNAEDELHEDAAPPAGARPFEVFSRIVPRGSDAFIPALLGHLSRYHDITLRAL